ncbi:hypothetical protein CEUSTIGMA_g4380.t1 [Chlamydomonas eustigma]|uniref:BZIP domain-containing protein n=1 Tax=Chlamydomonas eustigma TaxID=1157962 RepID=A0A250X1G8_9CHLO|nr:hypothetical protein CEUSTIGMA_g4380.t1 [Chlamydomonas eustigma]|eukprot:GAX76933.1 hypothetical protein CEUSTIGMA_g4380.t1 [Chlamydomonas eustigma]
MDEYADEIFLVEDELQLASSNGFGVAWSAPIKANSSDATFLHGQGQATFESQHAYLLGGHPSVVVSSDMSLLPGVRQANFSSRGSLHISPSPSSLGGVVKVKGASGRSSHKKHLGSNITTGLDSHVVAPANGGGAGLCSTSEIPEEILKAANYDMKKARRIQANRESAIKSKERKAQYSMTLDHQLQDLNEEVETLTTRISALRSHNDSLGQYVRDVSGQCNQLSQLLADGLDKNRRLSELVLNLQSSLGIMRRLPQDVLQDPALGPSSGSNAVMFSSSMMEAASQKLGSRDPISEAVQLPEPTGSSSGAFSQTPVLPGSREVPGSSVGMQEHQGVVQSNDLRQSNNASVSRRDIFAEAVAAAAASPLGASFQATQQQQQQNFNSHAGHQDPSHYSTCSSSPLAVPPPAASHQLGPTTSSQHCRTMDYAADRNHESCSPIIADTTGMMSMSIISPTTDSKKKPGLLSVMVQQQQQQLQQQ